MILQDGQRHAVSESLSWDVSDEKLTLTGRPTLQTPDGKFIGGKITIFRQLEEVRCEQGCRIELKAMNP